MAPAPRTNHFPDGTGGLAKVARGDHFKLVRQQPLLDEQNRILARIKSNSAIVPSASTTATFMKTN